jgi:hypothetical protein
MKLSDLKQGSYTVEGPPTLKLSDLHPSEVSIEGEQQPESLPKRLLRSTIDTAVPIVGAMGAAALAAPETGGFGAIPAGALGYAGGKQVAKAMNRYLLGDEQPAVGTGQALANAGKDVRDGLLFEVGGRALSEVPGVAKGAYGSFKDFLRTKMGQGLEYTPIANKAAVEDAARSLNLDVPRGVLTSNPTFQKLESGLSQNSSAFSTKVRDKYNAFNKGIKDAGEKIADLGVGDRYSAGAEIKGDLSGQIAKDREVTSGLYNELTPDLQKIQPNQNVINRVFGDLKKNPIFQTKGGKAYLEDAKSVALQQPELNSLKEWRTSVGNEIGNASTPLDQNRATAIQQAATKIRDESIHALKSELPKEMHPEVDDFINQVSLADATHKSTINEINSVKDLVGSKDFKSPVHFQNKIQEISEEDLAKRAAGLDVSSMQALKENYPSVFQKVKQARLDQLVQSSTGAKGFNINSFLKQYGKMDQQMKDLVFEPKWQQHIENLKIVSQAIPEPLGKSGTPEGLNFMNYFSPRQNATALGVNAILNDAERAAIPKIKPSTPSGPIVPKDYSDFANRASRPAQVLEMFKGRSEPAIATPAAAETDKKGQEKWANDGFQKLLDRANKEQKERLLRNKSSMLDDNKVKGLLMVASDLSPDSKMFDKISKQVSDRLGLHDSINDMVSGGPFRDTGRRPDSPSESVDSFLGAPARVFFSKFLDQNSKDLPRNKIIPAIKAAWESVGKDPKGAPSGFDIASKTLGIDDPYLGAAVSTVADLAQVPVGFVAKLAKVTPGFSAAIRDLSKVKNEGKIADASALFKEIGKEPPSTDAKIAQLHGQTGEVRDAMPELVNRARTEYNTANRNRSTMSELNEERQKYGTPSQKSAYDNPRNQPPKVDNEQFKLPPTEAEITADRIKTEAETTANRIKFLKDNDMESRTLHGGPSGDVAFRLKKDGKLEYIVRDKNDKVVSSFAKLADADEHYFKMVEENSSKQEPYKSPKVIKASEYFDKGKESAKGMNGPGKKFDATSREDWNQFIQNLDDDQANHVQGILNRDLKNITAEHILQADNGPSHLPYVSDTGHKFPLPNYSAKPTGQIGEPRINHSANLNSSAPDPFQWMDHKYGAGKQLLKRHDSLGMPAEINTSSDLISHKDYIDAIPKGSTVNLYMTSPDDSLNRFLFPGNPSLKRLEGAAKKLEEAGIDVKKIYPTVEEIIRSAKDGLGNKSIEQASGMTEKQLRKVLSERGALTDAEKAAGITKKLPKKGGE